LGLTASANGRLQMYFAALRAPTLVRTRSA